MNRRRILQLLAIVPFLVSLCAFPFASFAETTNGDLVNRELSTYASEFAKVRSAVGNAGSEWEFTSQITGRSVPSYDAAYRVFDFINPDIVGQYEETGSIRGMLSDQYLWRVPVNETTTVLVQPKGNTCEIIASFTNENPEMPLDIVDKVQLSTLLASEDSRLQSVTDIVYVRAPMYYLEFAYLDAGEAEYLVPYGNSAAHFGLEAGRVYTSSDVMTQLGNAYGELDPNADLGVPAEKEIPQSVVAAPPAAAVAVSAPNAAAGAALPWIFSGAGVLLAAAVITVTLLVRRSRKAD